MTSLSWADVSPRAAARAPSSGRRVRSFVVLALIAASLALTGPVLLLAVHSALTTAPMGPAPQPVGAKSATATAAKPGAIGTSDQPIDVESDQLDHHDQQRVSVYTGNVVAVQGLARLRTPKLTVYYAARDADAPKSSVTVPQAGPGEIERLEAEGPVHYTTPTERAIGDHGTYIADGDTITLSGHVTMLQGRNVATGDKLVIEQKTGHWLLTSDPTHGPPHQIRTVLFPAQASPDQVDPQAPPADPHP